MNTNVLVVDDSPIVRKMIRMALQQAGVEDGGVTEAENGQTALDRSEERQPDLVLLDINMPVMDGEQFLVALQDRDVDIPIVIVSTERNAKRLARMAGLGARARLPKPFKPEELREMIEKFVN